MAKQQISTKKWFHNRAYVRIAMPLCAVALFSGCSNGLWDKYYKMGMDSLAHGKPVDAESPLLLAVTQSEQFELNDIRRAQTMLGLGECYMAQRRYSEAEQSFNKSLEIINQNKNQEKLAVENLNQLGGSLDMQKKYSLATAAHKRALEIATKSFGKDKPETLALAENYAECLLKTASYPEAERVFKQLLPIEEQTYGKNSVKLQPMLEGYAELLSKTRRKVEADKVIARCKSLDEKNLKNGRESKIAEGW